MKFRSLIRKPVPGNEDTWIQEPTGGIMSSFAAKLQEFPKLPGDNDRIDSVLFSGARILVCLFEGKTLSLAKFVNYLNAENPELWPVSVLESDRSRQILDALETPYFVRVVEWFVDQLPAGEFNELQDQVREVWPDLAPKGNE